MFAYIKALYLCTGVNNSPVQNNRKCNGDNMCMSHRQLNRL